MQHNIYNRIIVSMQESIGEWDNGFSVEIRKVSNGLTLEVSADDMSIPLDKSVFHALFGRDPRFLTHEDLLRFSDEEEGGRYVDEILKDNLELIKFKWENLEEDRRARKVFAEFPAKPPTQADFRALAEA